MTKKTALITGASSGIGKATAVRFAQEGVDLVICGRNSQALSELKITLEQSVKVHVLIFDVRDKVAVNSALNQLPTEFSKIDILINNAGNAHGLDPIQSGSLDDWDAMIDGNVKGLLYVSQPIIQQMIKKQGGHIIHIGSTAGKEVYPNGNVYCASKHAVDALNKAMRMDLNPFGIRVGAIHPGLVETNFSAVRFKGNAQRAEQVYKGYQALTADDIADIIYFVISRPYHVNIADLIVMPTAQASSTQVLKS